MSASHDDRYFCGKRAGGWTKYKCAEYVKIDASGRTTRKLMKSEIREWITRIRKIMDERTKARR